MPGEGDGGWNVSLWFHANAVHAEECVGLMKKILHSHLKWHFCKTDRSRLKPLFQLLVVNIWFHHMVMKKPDVFMSGVILHKQDKSPTNVSVFI